MNILSFNTTGAGTQFCLEKNSEMFFLETEFSKHSEIFFPLLDDFLSKHNTKLDEIDVFGVVNGPGSFTGIRIGISVLKMFCFAKQKPCIVVNALEVLAYNIFEQNTNQKRICSVINAGAENVYYELFEVTKKELKTLSSPRVCSFSHFQRIKEKLGDVFVCYYDDGKQTSKFEELEEFRQELKASSLGKIIEMKTKKKEFCEFEKVCPIYLRDSQAEKIVFKDFEIKKTTKQDIDKILNLEKLSDDGMAWSETALKQSFANESFECFLLFVNGDCLGYVSIMNLVDEYEILRITVHPNARRQGVAKNLLNFLFEKAKKEDVKSLVLEVDEFNFSAQLLYEQMEFDVVGKRPKYYHDGKDGLIMRKYIQME